MKDVIYDGSWYSWFIFLISLLDFSIYNITHNNTTTVPDGLIVVYIIVTIIQIVDYILLLTLSGKENISISGLVFLLYSIIFIFVIVSIIVDIVQGAKHTFSFTDILYWKFSCSAPMRGYLPSLNLSRKK